jgi:amino acid transporter
LDTPTPRFQFSLATLLLAVTALAILVALREANFSHTSLIGLTLLLLIAVHVAGNAFGTHLRDHSELRTHGEAKPEHAIPLQQHPINYPTKRSESMNLRRFPGTWVVLGVIGGVCGGAFLGGLMLYNWLEQGWSGWLLGTCSAAVLGGTLAFLLASFMVIAYRAWEEATRENDHRPH